LEYNNVLVKEREREKLGMWAERDNRRWQNVGNLEQQLWDWHVI